MQDDGLYYVEDQVIKYFDDLAGEYLGIKKSNFSLGFFGFYDINIKLKFNLDQQTIIDVNNGNKEHADAVTFGNKKGINAYAKLHGKFYKTLAFSKINRYIPDKVQDITGKQFADVTTKAELDGDINGTLIFQRTYNYRVSAAAAKYGEKLVKSMLPLGVKTPSIYEDAVKAGALPMPTYTDEYSFTGLVGSINLKIKIEKDKNFDYDISQGMYDKGNLEPKHFVFIEPFKMKGKPQPLFPEFEN